MDIRYLLAVQSIVNLPSAEFGLIFTQKATAQDLFNVRKF
jgi:hypothetical protein